MIFDLPQPNPAYTADLTAARSAADLAAHHCGTQELAAAARILRATMGDQAARLVATKDTGYDGQPNITLLLLFDAYGTLLWFNPEFRYDLARNYPGAAHIGDDIGNPPTGLSGDAATAVEDHLELAYTAFQGVNGALDTTSDPHLDRHLNLIVLDISEALDQPKAQPTFAGLLTLAQGLAELHHDGERLPDGTEYLLEGDEAASLLRVHIEAARDLLRR
ncbi:hypothetical protein [Actinoplanes derwentensis]|uniref:Uncharacterized protein n=1 Tax=Actinoplanes derwentensis TaxID=113562 RepID=A0A1H2CUE4_9ACTN|nr:hypothetical protein [Actinoplanes derwentensis]GID81950.1 hypothetical protein Ade03nite_08740 [Actinoplanes derwentensis]SDT74170.1 hypothetical protein SAMN04489716_6899 [Actinoplanes derwentensis]